jgi:hypothetical protein
MPHVSKPGLDLDAVGITVIMVVVAANATKKWVG